LERKKLFSALTQDLKSYCADEDILNGNSEIWSLNWILAHYLTHTYSLFPSHSLIENIGFDGTGVHSEATEVFCHRNCNPNLHAPEFHFPSELAVNSILDRKIGAFLDMNSKKTMFKRNPDRTRSTKSG
jgi:hypothetical protein